MNYKVVYFSRTGKSNKVAKNKIHLVMTSNGSTLKNRSGFKSVSDIVGTKQNEDNVINNLVDKLL